MFCPKCGKEINKGNRFCTNCGEEIKINNEQENVSSNSDTKQNTISAVDVAKRDSKEWKKGLLGKCTIVCIVILFVLGLKEILPKVVEGNITTKEILMTPLAIIFMVSGVVMTYGELKTPLFARKRVEMSIELMEQFECNSYEKLRQIALNSKCPWIKNIGYDELGCISIKGKYSIHTLVIENGKVNILTKKSYYKAQIEANTIMAYLVKENNPNVNINAMDIEKENKKMVNINMMASIPFIASFVCVAFVMLLPASEDYISFVAEAVQDDYQVTYMEAFENYFDNEEWVYFESEGIDVVEFTGLKDGNRYVVQFELFYDEGYFNLYTIEVDGEPQNELIQAMIMTAIFTNSDVETSNNILDTNNDISYIENEEEYDFEDIDNIFVGTWWDLDSQRCNMEITRFENCYDIAINWSNSASDGYTWYYWGTYDPELGVIACNAGSKFYSCTLENGETGSVSEYTDGTATLWIGADGYLYWDDDVENAGETCYFEKAIY